MAETDHQGMYRPNALPLEELESKDSFFVQAADFAAGIAKALWELNNSLVHVATNFDYVTYNGKRINEDQAAYHQRIIDARKD